jgi:hypothetical protein
VSDIVDDVLARTNEARSHKRAPTLEELGGEEALLLHAEELASSVVAGATCLTISSEWEMVIDQEAALALFGQSFRSCGDAVVSEVAEAITTLPAMKAAQVAPALLSALEAGDNPTRSAYAGELLVTLATAEVVGWASVTPELVDLDPQEQAWPASEVNMRSAMRIALARPDDAVAAEAFLANMSIEPMHAADANFALGQIAFNRIAQAVTVDGIDETLLEASSFFAAAVMADEEHDDARFMESLTRVVQSVRTPADDDELEESVESLQAAAGHIARFGSDALTSTALEHSTRAAWVQAADLAARAARAIANGTDLVSSYEVLEAVFEAQRFARAVKVGGEIWFDSIEHSLHNDQALIDAASRIVEMKSAGPLADELRGLLNRYEESQGKVEAGQGEPATRSQLLDRLVVSCIDDGMGTLAGLFADLGQNELLGTSEFDGALSRVMQPLLDDVQVSEETARAVTLTACYVLSYARRKTDATKAFGGFGDLANAEVDKPLEHHLQDDIGQAMSTTPLGTGWTDERTNMSGGRADGRLVVERTQIPFEFKAEGEKSDRESLQHYVGQAERYTGGTAACAFLVVLDTTKDSARYNDIAAQSWTVSIPSTEATGRTTHVITVAIPANMPSPSVLSKKTKKGKAR